MDSETWLAQAREYFAAQNWIAALSSLRNALRIDCRNLTAWHLGIETLLQQKRQFEARRYAKLLLRFALPLGNKDELEFAQINIEAIDQYFATEHLRRGETDLTHHAARGDLEKVRSLLEKGADPNERNRTDWTPLHRVAMYGSPEMVRLLRSFGANLEAEDSLQETPLVTACRFENAALVPVFLELGANVNHVAKEKHTALFYAISSMKDLSTVQALISAGADPNETYAYGDNPFLIAVSAQKPAVVNYLMPLTKDVARLNKHGVCALHFAAGYNDIDLLEKLIARGVDVNFTTPWGGSALMQAAADNCVEAARFLLAHGADPAIQSESGETAEIVAERRENQEILELLRSHSNRA
ncbi:MAG: ankyrin repeat domain-containing protein [Leptospirales bacterium]|nr:ankyrin repeat domain-containing protein [Leptospirales bacterium]